MKRKVAEAYYEKYCEEIENEALNKRDLREAEEEWEILMEELKEDLKSYGHETWLKLDRLASLRNLIESKCCKEMYLKGFMDHRKLQS